MQKKLTYIAGALFGAGLVAFSAVAAQPVDQEMPKIGSTLNSKQDVPLSQIPQAVLKAIEALHPEFKAQEAEKEFKHDKVYLDVEGELNGLEVEFDLLQMPDGWTIVEVQRDLHWEDLPTSVAEVLTHQAPDFEPRRIIESIQHNTGTTIYEFYAVSSEGIESRKEVMLKEGVATVLQKEWQH